MQSKGEAMSINIVLQTAKLFSEKNVLIFDLEGTLIDTDRSNFLAYQEAFYTVKKVDLTSLHKDNARFTRETLKSVAPDLTLEEYEKIVHLKNGLYHKYLEKTEVITSTLEIIKRYAQTNTIVLATRSHKQKADELLTYHRLSELFDYTFYREDYDSKEISKFKYAVDFLKIDLRFVVVFDNEQAEIDQARNAGISAEHIVYL